MELLFVLLAIRSINLSMSTIPASVYLLTTKSKIGSVYLSVEMVESLKISSVMMVMRLLRMAAEAVLSKPISDAAAVHP